MAGLLLCRHKKVVRCPLVSHGWMLQRTLAATTSDTPSMGEATKGIMQKARMAKDLYEQQAAIENQVKERCAPSPSSLLLASSACCVQDLTSIERNLPSSCKSNVPSLAGGCGLDALKPSYIQGDGKPGAQVGHSSKCRHQLGGPGHPGCADRQIWQVPIHFGEAERPCGWQQAYCAWQKWAH